MRFVRSFRLIACAGVVACAIAAALASGGHQAAKAQDARTVPQNAAQVKLSFAPVVKRAAPAVVNIYTRRVVERRVSPFLRDPFFRRFFGERSGGGPLERLRRRRVQNSLGSGVIVSDDGFLVTNHHVVRNADEIQVVLADGREFSARVVLKDDKTDLAVLKVETNEKLPFLEFHDSDKLAVGDLVLAIGNPFGVGQTVTSGIISALARSHRGISDYQFFIQTDAAINPGNSGGALINVDGLLVGINTAIFSRSGGSNGIGFAIPSNMVRVVVRSARKGGQEVMRPWLGVKLQRVTPDIATALGLKRPRGALITQVFKNNPAARAGLRRNDVVVAIDGVAVTTPQELRYRVGIKPAGEVVALSAIRKGKPVSVRVKLELPKALKPGNLKLLTGRQPLQGAQVADLTPALADRLGLDPARGGVVVVAVRRGIARRFLRPRDILVSVEGERITSLRDLERLLAEGPRPEWQITIRRGRRVLRLRIAG